MKKFLLPLLVVGIFLVVISLRAQKIPCANTGSCTGQPTLQVENGAVGTFLGQTVAVPDVDLTANPPVLGVESDEQPKHIYVDLENQTLYAFEGKELFMQTLVSTGKWGRTPPGEYKIWMKIRSTRMSGGSGSDYYNLPNVPYVMFFYNDQVAKDRGYSFHGAYWHNNFGHEMSHGCVNMRTIDAKALYEWAHPVATKASVFASAEDPGTEASICTKIELTQGELPTCVE